ncbi:MAG: lipid-A-disaccharide synthase [Paracoccaceae bacterium]
MKVFLIAGEPSGDALGAALIDGLATLVPVTLAGVGGPQIQARGLRSLFPMEELSIMGLAEVLPKYRALKRRIRETAEAIAREAPDVVVTIDSPDFCLRVLALAKAANPGLKTVHYVAPSVWAWRPGRAAKMARVVDHVLALLPFEPPYMQAAGMTCDFVGHPVTTQAVACDAEAQAFRAAQGIAPDAPLVLALPGSRKGEIARLGPIFGAVMARVALQVPSVRVVVPTVAARADQVRALCADWPGRPVILDAAQSAPEIKRAAFKAADAALAASGTVSLELAASDTPMVIAYRMNPLSHAIISRMLRVDTVTLVNLVSETRAVPEFIGSACTPDAVTPALLALLAGQSDQRAAMALTMDRLGRGGEAPGLRAARSVLSVVGHGA